MGAAGKHQWIEFRPINNTIPLIVDVLLLYKENNILVECLNKCNTHSK